MKFFNFKKLNFYFEFFEKNSITPYYKSIYNKTNGKSLNREDMFPAKLKHEVYTVSCIPPYLETVLDGDAGCKAFKVSSRTGFIIDLAGYNNVEDYMGHGLKRQKKDILRKMKRLETCFDIRVKTLFGEIDKEEYDLLFDTLETMIQRRFLQKNMEHAGLKRWEDYKHTVHQMVLNKKASLFGIYDKDKPISISLSYHFQNILISTISSYDIDYAKFGLGNIQVLKKIEWCLENGYDQFDMMWGDLRYKREWCNKIFSYEDHVLCTNKNLPKLLFAYTLAKLSILKKHLQKKKLPLNFNVLTFLKKEQEQKREKRYKLVEIDGKPSTDQLLKLNIEDSEEYAFLREPVYTFQYRYSEHSNNTDVYKLLDKAYLVHGKHKKMKIEFV